MERILVFLHLVRKTNLNFVFAYTSKDNRNPGMFKNQNIVKVCMKLSSVYLHRSVVYIEFKHGCWC